MTMTKSKKHRPSTEDLVKFALLIALNWGIAFWLQQHFSTTWSWEIPDSGYDAGLHPRDYASLTQLLILGFSLSEILKMIVASINCRAKKFFIPKILVQVGSILIYCLLALFGAITIYGLPVKNLLAASGLISVILAYAFRELIADILASAQIQMNHLARIGDWVGLKHNDEAIIAKVIDLDQQIVTLRDSSHITRIIRNSHFLQQTIINFSGHGNIAVRHADLELSSRLPHTEILPILENALDYVHHTNQQFHGEYHARIKSLGEGNLKFTLEYRCHPSISCSLSNHLVMHAALRFLKCAGFDLTPPQSQTGSLFEAPDRVPHRLLQAKEFGVLKSLNINETQLLEDKARFIHLHPQESLLSRGELKDSIYIVCEGRLSIELPQESAGKVLELAKAWPGDVIGEMSLLTGEPHSANVIAQTRVSLIALAKADLEPILKNNPQLTQDIVDQVLLLKQINEKALHHKIDQTERKNLLKRVFQFLGI